MVSRQLSGSTFVIMLGLVFALQVAAQNLFSAFIANQNNSSIGFAGEHAGMPFEGVFETWEASITLPPSASPSITATFDLGSAKTGDRTYDSTLPEGDWFDTENTPQGTFESSQIDTLTLNESYQVSGTLTLRGISKPVSFILNQSGNRLIADIEINRLEFNIGADSDPDAEWVSRDIALTLNIGK